MLTNPDADGYCSAVWLPSTTYANDAMKTRGCRTKNRRYYDRLSQQLQQLFERHPTFLQSADGSGRQPNRT